MTKEAYAQKARQWAKALKRIDPSIVLILCGETGHSEWDFHTLTECLKYDSHALAGGSQSASLIDMHSIHIYTSSHDPVKNVLAPRSAERAIEIAAGMIDLARIQNRIPPTVPRQTICFDEWNVWDPQRAPGHEGAEENYDLSDALAVGVWLNVFIRQSKYVAMANIAQSVNVISPLMTDQDGLRRQTTWWPLLLFTKYMRGHTVATNVSCGFYDGPTESAWQQSTIDNPWLDVSTTIGDDGWVNMVVVNAHPDIAIHTDLAGVGSSQDQVKVYSFGGNKDMSRERVRVHESEWEGKGSYTFLPFSFTMLRWRPSKKEELLHWGEIKVNGWH